MTARLLTRPGLGLADSARWLGPDQAGRLALTDAPGLSVPEVLGEALARLDPRSPTPSRGSPRSGRLRGRGGRTRARAR